MFTVIVLHVCADLLPTVLVSFADPVSAGEPEQLFCVVVRLSSVVASHEVMEIDPTVLHDRRCYALEHCALSYSDSALALSLNRALPI